MSHVYLQRKCDFLALSPVLEAPDKNLSSVQPSCTHQLHTRAPASSHHFSLQGKIQSWHLRAHSSDCKVSISDPDSSGALHDRLLLRLFLELCSEKGLLETHQAFLKLFSRLWDSPLPCQAMVFTSSHQFLLSHSNTKPSSL